MPVSGVGKGKEKRVTLGLMGALGPPILEAMATQPKGGQRGHIVQGPLSCQVRRRKSL